MLKHNPIYYAITKNLVKNQIYGKPTRLLKTKVSKKFPIAKQYYLIELERAERTFTLSATDWKLHAHHLSVYAEQSTGEHDGLSAIHHTIECALNTKRIIIHIYYDHRGNYVNLNVSDPELSLCNEESMALQACSESIVGNLVSSLSELAYNTYQTLFSRYDEAENQASELSMRINFEGENPPQLVDSYLKKLQQCRTHLQTLNQLSFDDFYTTEQFFTTLINKVKNIKRIQPKNTLPIKNTPLRSVNNEKSPKPTPAKATHAPRSKVKKVKPAAKKSCTPKYQERLNIADSIQEPAFRIVARYRVLSDATPSLSYDNEVLKAYHKINQCIVEANQCLVNSINANNAPAVKQLLTIENLTLNPNHVFTAARQGLTDITILLINRFKCNVNLCDPNAKTGFACLLGVAAEKRNFELFRWLLSKGANPNVQSFLGASTLLLHLISSDLPSFVHEILKYPVDVNRPQRTDPFIVSLDKTRDQFMIKNLHMMESTLNTPLYQAIVLGNREIISRLLAKGASFNNATRAGYYPIAASCMNSELPYNADLTRFLVTECGADINLTHGGPGFKCTPLYFQAQKPGRLDAVTDLLALGSDPNIACMSTDKCLPSVSPAARSRLPSHLTVVSAAALKGHSDYLELILNSGKVTQQTWQDAVRCIEEQGTGNQKIIELLQAHSQQQIIDPDKELDVPESSYYEQGHYYLAIP